MAENRFLLVGTGLLCLGLAACSSSTEDTDATGETIPEDAVDVRVPMPEPMGSAQDFVSEELVIPASEERQFCVFMTSPEQDLYVQEVEDMQGRYGHHAILMTTDLAEPDGTIVDCTEAEAMADFSLTLLPLGLPDGYAQRMPAGHGMVLQSHYLNSTTTPLLVRDVVRLHTVHHDDVVTPVAPFATHHYDVDVPPMSPKELVFDCEVPRDAELITVGGHLHEEGAYFTLEHGPADGPFEVVYQVDEWKPSYRDAPPITGLVNTPVTLHAGDIFRTTCAWNNTTEETLSWPSEMCSAFGLMAGDFEPFECNLGAPQR